MPQDVGRLQFYQLDINSDDIQIFECECARNIVVIYKSNFQKYLFFMYYDL